MLALHVRPIALLAGELDGAAIAAEISLAGVLAQMLAQGLLGERLVTARTVDFVGGLRVRRHGVQDVVEEFLGLRRGAGGVGTRMKVQRMRTGAGDFDIQKTKFCDELISISKRYEFMKNSFLRIHNSVMNSFLFPKDMH